MKVKALCNFKDLQANCFRQEGEFFEVTKERANELSVSPYGPLVEIVESDPKEMEPTDPVAPVQPKNEKAKAQ